MSTLFDTLWSEAGDDAVVVALRGGADPEGRDADGETPLYRAAVENQPGAVRLLLAAGADPGRASGADDGDLPLCGAACGGHTEVVRALLAAGAEPDQEEGYGFTALAWAVRLGHTGTARVLLAAGADPDRPGPDGLAPLTAAARRGSPSLVRALLEHGAGHRREALDEALDEARRWIGVDMAAVLRRGLVESGGAADTYEAVVRRVPEDGGITVVVELLREDGAPSRGDERQTGHAAIATLLEGALGEPAPPEVLAERALRCGDPGRDDWTTAVEALAAGAGGSGAGSGAGGASGHRSEPGSGHRSQARSGSESESGPGSGSAWAGSGPGSGPGSGSAWAGTGGASGHRSGSEPGSGSQSAGSGAAAPETVFVTATAWCASPDPLRRALGARVLAALPGYEAGAVPVLRGLAAETAEVMAAGDREPAVSVAVALGRCGDGAAVPELLALAAHPDAEVRREVAAALAGIVPPGDAAALERITALSRDPDPRVRDWATLALAELPDDTPATREALAARLADPDPETIAEAARGLALRQDPRAVDPLASLLADSDPEGPARETALAALPHVTDPRVRRRLEWTTPRCR
ncbi:ankyrin repeat domain-containing protein [Streptomyces fradiae]|uniref:ankyrin repeat domain-containing protein n=1 Tax=Streptomyces fradiae TaxID=1906 RepID=UPI003514F77F